MKNLICAVTILAVSSAQAGTVIHVDVTNCPGPGNGMEGDPYCSIQTAVVAAMDGDEIVDAPGTYFETDTRNSPSATSRSRSLRALKPSG